MPTSKPNTSPVRKLSLEQLFAIVGPFPNSVNYYKKEFRCNSQLLAPSPQVRRGEFEPQHRLDNREGPREAVLGIAGQFGVVCLIRVILVQRPQKSAQRRDGGFADRFILQLRIAVADGALAGFAREFLVEPDHVLNAPHLTRVQVGL